MDNYNGNNLNANNKEKNQQFYQMNSTKNQTDLWGTGAYHSNIQQNKNIFTCNNAVNKNRSFVPVLCCCIIAFSIIFFSVSLLIVNGLKKDKQTHAPNESDVVTEIYMSTDDEQNDTSDKDGLSQPYFPQVSGYMDREGRYVKKGKEYKYNDGSNVCYLPDVLVESDYTDFVETDIQNTLYSMFSEEIETRGLSFPVFYDVYCVDDVISLVVVFVSDDYNEMKVYNFHRETGAEVTNSDLLEMLGISEESFYDRSISLQKQKIDYKFKNIDEEAKELYENNESYIKYSSESHMKEAFLYVDELGYLHILNELAIPSYLGATWCDIIYT